MRSLPRSEITGLSFPEVRDIAEVDRKRLAMELKIDIAFFVEKRNFAIQEFNRVLLDLSRQLIANPNKKLFFTSEWICDVLFFMPPNLYEDFNQYYFVDDYVLMLVKKTLETNVKKDISAKKKQAASDSVVEFSQYPAFASYFHISDSGESAFADNFLKKLFKFLAEPTNPAQLFPLLLILRESFPLIESSQKLKTSEKESIFEFAINAIDHFLFKEGFFGWEFNNLFTGEKTIPFWLLWVKKRKGLLSSPSSETRKMFLHFWGGIENVPQELKGFLLLAEPANTPKNPPVSTPSISVEAVSKNITEVIAYVVPEISQEENAALFHLQNLDANEENHPLWVKIGKEQWQELDITDTNQIDLTLFQNGKPKEFVFRFAPSVAAPKETYPESPVFELPAKKRIKMAPENSPVSDKLSPLKKIHKKPPLESSDISPSTTPATNPICELEETMLDANISPESTEETPLEQFCTTSLRSFQKFSIAPAPPEYSWKQPFKGENKFWWEHVLDSAVSVKKVMENLNTAFAAFDISIYFTKNRQFKISINDETLFAFFDDSGAFNVEKNENPDVTETEKLIGTGVLSRFALLCSTLGNFPPLTLWKKNRNNTKLNQSACNKIEKNEPLNMALFNQDGTYQKKQTILPSELLDDTEIVLQDALFRFPGDETIIDSTKTIETAVYAGIRDQLDSETTKKYLILRIVSTIKAHLQIPFSEKDKAPIRNETVIQLLLTVLSEAGIDLDLLIDADTSSEDFLDFSIEDVNFLDIFIDRLEACNIPVSYARPILISLEDLQLWNRNHSD